MIKYIVIFCLSFSAMADTDWARVAMNTAVILDWAQTRDIDNHIGHAESNKILGAHPSDAEINHFFIGLLLAYNLTGEYLISEQYKMYWYGGIAIVHGEAVMHNYNSGLSFRFD